MASHRSRCCDQWGDQVSASTRALAAFEVTVRGRCRALPWFEQVRVHAQAHGTTRGAPLSTELEEDLIQAFIFRLLFHNLEVWHHDHAGVRINLTTFHDLNCSSQFHVARIVSLAIKESLHLNS